MNMTIVIAVKEMRQHTVSSPTHPLCYPILRLQGRTTTARSRPKHNEAKAITMWQFMCMLILMQLFLHHMLIGWDRQVFMRPPPPLPRNGTVIWNCHMGGDPNPKGGGMMKQMRNFIGAYVVAQEKHAYLYRGNLSFEYTDNTESGCNAPLESFVDIDSLLDLSDMLVDIPVGEHFDPSCEPCDQLKWTHNRTVLFKQARKQFKPSHRLRRLMPQNLCPPDSCVCLHSRLEEDFLKVFGQTVAGSGNSIGNVMKNHMQAGGFGNATVLYVAGEQQDDYLSIPQFINFTSKPSYGLRQFENAMIDLQICQNALYHVGTSRSIFDEWISED